MIDYIFYIFALLLIFSGLLVILLKNPVHSVLFLILAFFNAAGLMILIGAEYIAMTLVIVYVGAIAVLFLFVVMMLDIDYVTIKKGLYKLLPIALFLGCLLFFLIYHSISESTKFQSSPNSNVILDKAFQTKSNVNLIGSKIYTDYVLDFQMSGILLLVAMIGAIVLTFRRREGPVKRQRIIEQVNRKKEDCVELVEVNYKKGIDV